MQPRDIELLIHDYADQEDAATPRLTFDDLVGPIAVPGRERSRLRAARARGPMVAVAVFAVTLLIVGGVSLALGLAGSDRASVVDEPTPQPTLPAPEPTTAPTPVAPTVAPVPVLALPMEWTRYDLGTDVQPVTIAGGPAGFVAAGNERFIDEYGLPMTRGVVWASPNGESWTKVPDQGWSGPDSPGGIVFGGGRYVAFGGGTIDDPIPVVSRDGVTWARPEHIDDIYVDGVSMSDLVLGSSNQPGTFGDFVAVTHSNGRYVAVGHIFEFSMVDGGITHTGLWGAAWTSTDAITWTRSPDLLEFNEGGGNDLADVTAGGDGFVAVGTGDFWDDEGHWWAVAMFWHSPDGLTWSRIPHDDAVFGNSSEPSDTWISASSITHGEAGYVAVGSGASWHSSDGLTWTRTDQHVGHEVAYGDGVYVAVGSTPTWDEAHANIVDGDAVFEYSTDGLTWTRVAPDPEIFSRTDACGDEFIVVPHSVAYGNGRFIVVGADSIAASDPYGSHPCSGSEYSGYVWIGE